MALRTYECPHNAKGNTLEDITGFMNSPWKLAACVSDKMLNRNRLDGAETGLWGRTNKIGNPYATQQWGISNFQTRMWRAGPEWVGMPRRGLAAAGARGKGEGRMSDGMERYGSDTRRCAVRWTSKLAQKQILAE